MPLTSSLPTYRVLLKLEGPRPISWGDQSAIEIAHVFDKLRLLVSHPTIALAFQVKAKDEIGATALALDILAEARRNFPLLDGLTVRILKVGTG